MLQSHPSVQLGRTCMKCVGTQTCYNQVLINVKLIAVQRHQQHISHSHLLAVHLAHIIALSTMPFVFLTKKLLCCKASCSTYRSSRVIFPGLVCFSNCRRCAPRQWASKGTAFRWRAQSAHPCSCPLPPPLQFVARHISSHLFHRGTVRPCDIPKTQTRKCEAPIQCSSLANALLKVIRHRILKVIQHLRSN